MILTQVLKFTEESYPNGHLAQTKKTAIIDRWNYYILICYNKCIFRTQKRVLNLHFTDLPYYIILCFDITKPSFHHFS